MTISHDRAMVGPSPGFSWLGGLRISSAFRMGMIAALMAAIFLSDTVTDLEIATAVFYIVVILLAVGRFENRIVVSLAAFCIFLTLASFALTKSGSREAGIVNCTISISAIAVTTYIALKMVAAEKAVHEARAQLVRIARVNSLCEVATSIAHEVNQPLSAIATSGDACLRWLAASPPNLDRAGAAAARVIDDANRASRIVARIRGHATGHPTRRQAVVVADVIGESVAFSRSEIDRLGISLRVALAEGMPPVWADDIQLQQVLGNLILNAIEAMAGVPPHRRTLSISAVEDDGGDIELGVEDSGLGVSEQDLARLFDAFWTTKQSGTGIGLAISRSIIEAHGGAIWAERSKPTGIRFRIHLPAHRPVSA